MYRLMIAVLLIATTGCVAGSDEPFETSPPARLVAADNPNVLLPDDFGADSGFAADPIRDLPGYPDYYCPTSLATRGQVASYLARARWGVDFEHPTYDGDFTDVSANMVHARAVGRVTDAGIMGACGEDAFCPTHVVTRAQMSRYVARITFDGGSPPAGDVSLSDTAGHPDADVMAWAASQGVPTCGPDAFCPDQAITRAEMASFLRLVVGDEVRGRTMSFLDVSSNDPHAMAIGEISRAGITVGCTAPVLGYRVNGYALTDRQKDWLVYLAGRWMPRLARAYGNDQRALEVTSNAVWWSLKQGVFGRFEDPFGHSVCHNSDGRRELDPFESCPQSNLWQVGLNAVHLPRVTDAELNSAVAALYPGESSEQLAAEVVAVGRSASRLEGRWEYPDWAEDRVINDGYLMRSWLVRDPAIAAWVLSDDIEAECVAGWSDICEAQERGESLHFASDPQIARQVREDLRELLDRLAPR